MDKRELSRTPVEHAPAEAMEIAGNADIDIYMSLRETEEAETLVLNLYQKEEMAKGNASPSWRTFLSAEDYITQNMTGKGVRWLAGRIDSVLGIDYWHCRKGCAFTDSGSRRLFEERFGRIDGMEHWHESLYGWQSGIVAERLKLRHEKELAHTNEMMGLVPEIPPGFLSWTKDGAISEWRYLVYKSGKTRKIAGYCTCCQKKATIDTKGQKARRGEVGTCPECGEQITFVPAGAQLNGCRDSYHSAYDNRKWACLFQKVEGGLVTRYFEIGVRFPGRDAGIERKPHYWNRELCRTFYIEGKVESFEYRDYKHCGHVRWCPDEDKVHCALALVYTGNLDAAIKDTEYQYCAIRLFQKANGREAIPVWRYMAQYPERKYYEFMVKTGLTDMLMEHLTNGGCQFRDVLDDKGATPQEVLGVPKGYVRLVLSMKPSLAQLRLIQQCGMDGVMPRPEEIRRWHCLFGCDDETLGMVNAHRGQTTLARFMDYIEKEAGMNGSARDAKADWKDYIRWAASLGYDLSDNYYFLPPNLKKAHGRAHAEYEKRRNRIEAARKRALSRRVNRICAIAARGRGYEMEADGLMVVVPQNADDIRREGNVQHHCVGSYVERVARGETMILFIRRISEPDTPYYTMEWADNHVVQCRGSRNCGMTDEVKAFVAAFERIKGCLAPTEAAAI